MKVLSIPLDFLDVVLENILHNDLSQIPLHYHHMLRTTQSRLYPGTLTGRIN